jgi:hypothetical protein
LSLQHLYSLSASLKIFSFFLLVLILGLMLYCLSHSASAKMFS